MDFETLYRNEVINVGIRIVGEDAKSQCRAIYDAMRKYGPDAFGDLSDTNETLRMENESLHNEMTNLLEEIHKLENQVFSLEKDSEN